MQGPNWAQHFCCSSKTAPRGMRVNPVTRGLHTCAYNVGTHVCKIHKSQLKGTAPTGIRVPVFAACMSNRTMRCKIRPARSREGGWGVPASIRRDRRSEFRLVAAVGHVPCGAHELVGRARPSKLRVQALEWANADAPPILRSACRVLQQPDRLEWTIVASPAARRRPSMDLLRRPGRCREMFQDDKP